MPEGLEKLIFITGGARSGKSRLAEEIASRSGGPVAYIATAAVYDEEMAERVEVHRRRRPESWLTVEETLHLDAELDRLPPGIQFVVLDCLTLWLSNRLLQSYSEASSVCEQSQLQNEILAGLELFCERLRRSSFSTVIVSNEVGCGIVPDTPLARVFRDLAGRANQLVAARADSVFLAVAGLSLKIKGGA
ncbi:MAG: bifunctional adenosylcobinamide kinase/adenosylcobinamide-phosphate guanylyltransferase [Dethiobacter sp.]|jgi:adenosylcobinamide kinase/adenosylcobinamide-phosphate guanylyltransferase|nr:bifunctional adenosylcobinamide kinase/adenosylcobinamide-phosphate guanylyltransferase [Dethiobacter sp.]